MKYNDSNKRPGLKDVWNASMLVGAKYGKYDIPYCPTVLTGLPEQIIMWDEAKAKHKQLMQKDKDYQINAFVGFFHDDYKFDGVKSSIWLFPEKAMDILKHYRGIITPDFSIYQDFPYPLKIYNTYRMRAFGYWAGKNGLEVINNVRWGTPESYHYSFEGIEQNSVVAIGTVGGSPRKLVDRKRFEEGFYEMLQKLSPQTIIIYGSSNYPCIRDAKKQGIAIVAFKSATAEYYEERKKNE